MQEPEIDPYAPPAAAPVPDSSPVRPGRVLFIGILFCAAGALVLGSMVWGLVARDRLDLNPAALLLPVGIGLLRGQTSSQWWASVWLVLGYAFCLVLVVADLTRPGQLDVRWGDVSSEGRYSSPVLITCCVLAGAVLATLHWLLISSKAAAYFRAKRMQVLRERFRPRRR